MRAKLNGATGQRYWRSLEELADTKEFRDAMQREFPAGASEWWDGLNRRNFLKLAAASLALSGLTACTRQPVHAILPYVNQPEALTPGEPLFYATAMTHSGFAQGVLVKSREGHPVKIDGNPEHPMTMGRSDVWMQASILDLYDPDRSQSVAYNGDISTWDLFLADLNVFAREQIDKQGAGLRILTETVTSPTLAWQIEQVLKRFPRARRHQFEPINSDNSRDGARLAFGRPVAAHYDFSKAKAIVSLDSDFLYTHPARIRNTMDFTNGRRISRGSRTMNRLFVAESSPTVTGTTAEHRLPTPSHRICLLAAELARRVGFSMTELSLTDAEARWVAAAANELEANKGAGIVIAGEWQPPLVHALAHVINEKLGSAGTTVTYSEPVEAKSENHGESISGLVAEMKAGQVQVLFILGGNPVFTSPADLDFQQALSKVKRSIHLSSHLDETSALTTWHIPAAHFLESWGDARACDGTISIQQPLIEPLYGGKTATEVIGAMLEQMPLRSDYDWVRAFWEGKTAFPDFEKGWRKALHDGFVADTKARPQDIRVNEGAVAGHLKSLATATNQNGIELNLRPDPNIWDGRFANNGWLMECPKPVTKLTWDNALLVSPALAQRERFQNGDIVQVRVGGYAVHAPALIAPGHADNSATLHLGYGRSRAGRVGNGVGVNAYEIRNSTALWIVNNVELSKTGLHHELVATQTHHALENPEREIYRAGTLNELLKNPAFVKQSVTKIENDETLYDPKEFVYDGYKWGMSIDLTTCIGCNSCIVACEVENNIPIVGKDEVRRNREMLWLRVDTYYEGSPDSPSFNHMPVPCMHCEHAPCELVCPVEATLHDHEGLNLQVYNRCVGTRFCSNNCPYKVRRFNFFQYANYHEPSLKPMYNPDVTVRWRGVMEKCTYCVQRISRARITAEKENRKIRDGEVLTACQQACPADAIVFGDMNDPGSRIARLKKHSLDYSMLGQLNTRPRTTYLAKVTNPA
jgi:molybdopterin-containing oxidoreductase family iron-sulfur binding subunit